MHEDVTECDYQRLLSRNYYLNMLFTLEVGYQHFN